MVNLTTQTCTNLRLYVDLAYADLNRVRLLELRQKLEVIFKSLENLEPDQLNPILISLREMFFRAYKSYLSKPEHATVALELAFKFARGLEKHVGHSEYNSAD